MFAPTYTLREAELGDVPAVARLARTFIGQSGYARMFELTVEDITTAIDSVVDSDAGVCILCECDGRVVGAILGTRSPVWLKRGETVAVELGWWVDPEHRGPGMDLLRAFERWASPLPVVVSDTIMDGSTPAGPLLEKVGYEMIERSFVRRHLH